MANDEQIHVALPKLYGAPAYARPKPVPVQVAERPFDPDELPLESLQTDEERELARQVTGRVSWGPVAESRPDGGDGTAGKRARQLRLRALTRRRGADERPIDG